MTGQRFSMVTRPAARFLRRFLLNRRGTSAMEFALIVPLFLMLLIGIVEISVMTFSSVGFDDAGRAASRLLKTGIAQKSDDPEAVFREGLCAALPPMIDCTQVGVDVRTYGDFESTSTLITLDEDGNPTDEVFAPGDSSSVNMVRLTYRWEFFTPLIGRMLSDNASNSVLLTTVSFLQTEPF